jgi:hypothetical protein
MMSMPVPGVNGTTNLIGWEGQVCAAAEPPASMDANSTSKQRMQLPQVFTLPACRTLVKQDENSSGFRPLEAYCPAVEGLQQKAGQGSALSRLLINRNQDVMEKPANV